MAEGENSQPIYTCTNRLQPEDPTGMFDFLPVYEADLKIETPKYSFSGTCYNSIDMVFTPTSKTTFDVDVTLADRSSALCTGDRMFFANTEIFHTEEFRKPGTYKLSFNMPTVDDQIDVAFGGIKVFMFCEGLKDEIESVIKTASAFVDPNADTTKELPQYMVDVNLEFLSEVMSYNMAPRETNFVDIDESLVSSGDFFGVVRLDGTSPMIMYGTGAHFSHCTMALEFDDGLYIVESQGAGYWPVFGIQRTPFAQWVSQARERDYNVIWLPLKDSVKAKFNVQAAQDFFWQTEGLPYGFHNFIYGWIDTVRDNLPPLFPNEFAPILAALYESVYPHSAMVLFVEGMNKRLGVEGYNITQIAALAAQEGMTVQDVIAMPEQDGWIYTSYGPTDGLSYVCSAYVTAQWKAAGLFGDDEINATEFQPHDVYQLDFFNKEFVRPEACVQADPMLPYCQIMGKYRIDFMEGDYGFVEPYSRMNERCATINPNY